MSKNKISSAQAKRAQKTARKSAKERTLREERRRRKREGRINERHLAPIEFITRERECNYRAIHEAQVVIAGTYSGNPAVARIMRARARYYYN